MANSTLNDRDLSERTQTLARRRLPVGAELTADGRTHFRVWAPAANRVDVVVDADSADSADRTDGADGRSVSLAAEGGGYFSGATTARAGERYRFRLDSSERLYPDPASRFQPDGPHGASQIVDPHAFAWSDAAWKGIPLEGQVIYELHAGTFTLEGTWEAASREIEELAALGVTVIELMPIAEFQGRFGWGYDGVDLYAPSHLYGEPDDLRRLVDHAHSLGVAVILDVVYNHLGPSGNYLRAFSPAYFTDRYINEWGDAINFDGEDAGPVRELFIGNAGYWIDEFHFDGLRLDATQAIFDRSRENVMAAIGRRVREAARGRSTIIVAENEPQDTRLVRPVDENGYGLDALWNDDFHHSAMVALTGHGEAYYSDTRGEPQEFISAAKYGYLFQGQHYDWQSQPRGTPSLDIAPPHFVAYLQNHNQVANSARGLRAHQLASPGKWRAMTALLLLQPSTPMLFQGQEFYSSSPFLYFADFDADLAEAVRKGRGEFLTQFSSVARYEREAPLDDPGDAATFFRCKLDFSERLTHAPAYALYRDLLRLRRETPAFSAARPGGAGGAGDPGGPGGIDGAILSAHAFVLRFFTKGHTDDRILIVNFGADLKRESFAEPLLAPPSDCHWSIAWTSEAAAYGGGGMPDLWPDGRWRIAGESAIVLSPMQGRERPRPPVRRRTA